MKTSATLLILAALSGFVVRPGAVESQSRESNGAVWGQIVTGPDSLPVEGAQVYLQGYRIGTLSDSSGRFLLLGVPEGSVIMRVQRACFVAHLEEVRVGPDGAEVPPIPLDMVATDPWSWCVRSRQLS